MISLEQKITQWDGKSSDDIEAIYKTHYRSASFITDIISFIGKPGLAKAASWLLKHHFDLNNELKAGEVKRIYRLLPKLDNWEAQLHILQCVPKMPIKNAEKGIVETFLRECLVNENKFVRAWAYNGFYELSMLYPEYKQETKDFFDMAMKDEVASVKARIRNIMKKGF